MPTNKIVLYYIEKITLEDARIICLKNNWDFSDNEIIFILNFARQYKEYLNKSAEAYEEALKILGKDYDTSYNLALVYHLLRDYNKAGINYCKAIQTDHMSFEAHYNLAILLKHLKFYKESLDEMEKATTLVTTSKTPYSHAAYVFNVLNDISSYAFLQASEEMSNGKIFNEG